jgi:hypothetical protein
MSILIDRNTHKLAAKAITVIQEALCAMKTDEADHLTRLRAVERLFELLELAQGKLQETAGVDSRPTTWKEFVVVYQKQGAKEVVASVVA